MGTADLPAVRQPFDVRIALEDVQRKAKLVGWGGLKVSERGVLRVWATAESKRELARWAMTKWTQLGR